EERGEQAGGGDLRSQARRPDDEDRELEPAIAHGPRVRRAFPTEAGTSLPFVTTAELAALDRRVLWHPFTQQQGWEDEEPVIIERALGTTLYDSDGKSYIDGVSSLWCNVHGHRHHAIDGAIRAQLDRVAHSTMLGLSHRPAIDLAQRLVDIAPDGLSRVFFSDNGSTAAEVALKMAFQWWQLAGEPQ